MSLTGDVNTLSLADLVQVSALNRRTCQIHVSAAHAEGDLYLDRGAVVHAWWGDLVGTEALYAMVNTPEVGFHVRTDVAAETRTIDAGWQELVMEAARRRDHGSVPRPRTRLSDPSIPIHNAAALRLGTMEPPGGQQPSFAAAATPRRARMLRVLLLSALALVAVVLGALGATSWRHGTAARAVAALPSAPTTEIFDAAQLTGPDDAPPSLIEGKAPSLPPSQWPVAPTIVCRLTIGADGVVQQSRVYRSRLELAAFEDAALAAVEKFRFRPAQHAGRPVNVTINWPVSFAAADGKSARTLRLKGSDTIGGALAPALARSWHARRGEVDVAIEALGSKTAFVGLFDGSADLGASSRPVNSEELKQAARLGMTLREFVIAYDGIALIVHPDNPVRALTLDQASRVFTGAAGDWSAVGGVAGPIRVISRPSYSGTHMFFKEKVVRRGNPKGTEEFASSAELIEDNREIMKVVASDRSAIAYVGHGWLGQNTRALAVATEPQRPPVLPTTNTIRDGTYPIYRPLLLYSRGAPTRDGADFLSFVLGPEGQALVRDSGFVPIDAPAAAVVAAAADTGDGAVIEPLRIPFAAGGLRLSTEARARLWDLRSRVGGARLLVIGHSDAEGGATDNHRLALGRAQSVASYLISHGVDRARIDVEADDAGAPIASNGSAAGRRQNRRADVFVLGR